MSSELPLASICPQQVMRNGVGPGTPAYYERMDHPPTHPSEDAVNRRTDMPPTIISRLGRELTHLPRQPLHSPRLQTPEVTAILFHVNNYPGYCFGDVQNGGSVDYPRDKVFAEHAWRQTTIRLFWPGYDNSPSVRLNARPQGRYITRAEVADLVLKLIADFWEVASKQSDPMNPFDLGPNTIRLQDIHLLSIHYYRDTWVPEIYIRF